MTYTVEYQWENKCIVIRLVEVYHSKIFPINLTSEEIVEAGKATIAEYEASVQAEVAKVAEIEALKTEHKATASTFEGLELSSNDTVETATAKQADRQVALQANQEAPVEEIIP